MSYDPKDASYSLGLNIPPLMQIPGSIDKFSYYQGFLEACQWFAIWNNGTQTIGVGTPLKAVALLVERLKREEMGDICK